jgi:hypothetical protein
LEDIMFDDGSTTTDNATEIDSAPTSSIVVARKPVTTLPELVNAFEEREAHDNDDVVLPLDGLRMSDAGNIVVPERGEFAFTEWSKHQASSLLGLRWDRWFESASLVEQAEEINRRFKRASGSVKVRTSQLHDDDTHADGTLRALVSPSYSPIRDSTIARLLLDALRHHDDELRLGRLDITDQSTSFTVKIGTPFQRGDAAEVGELWGGLLIRNSSVGFASLLGVLHLLRLACLNGLVLPLPNATILKRRHRGTDYADLPERITAGLVDLHGRLHQGADVLSAAVANKIASVEVEVRGLLREAGLPLRLAKPVLDAFEKEPGVTKFAVSQAVTLAAQQQSPEVRLALEEAAGAYLRSAA